MNNIEITSVNNELVKSAAKLQQKKYRDSEKKFLLEGFKAIEEAIAQGIEVENIFVEKENHSKYAAFKSPVILTNQAVLKKISSTDTAPEAVAVAKQKIFTFEDIKSAKKVILLENIKDLGNLGTILRTAAAFSQDAVILMGETADLYNPKCVRSAAGNLWKTPVVQIKDFAQLKKIFGNFEKAATLPKAKDTTSLKDFMPKPPYLIMFGSEADGLSADLIDFADKKVIVEMSDRVESLNLAISVGIVLHQITAKA